MKSIIVPTDFSIKSYSALTLAKRLVRKSQGTIHLIHVIEPISNQYLGLGEHIKDLFDDTFIIKLVEKTKQELSALKKTHEENGFTIKTTVLVGDPYQKIQEKVKEVNADMIIVGDKGVTDSEEFFLGSLTDKIVRNATCPVITTKAVIDESKFENIVYATDMVARHEPMMAILKAFERHFNSTIHIVKINTRRGFKNDIDVRVSMEKLADHFDLKNYTLNVYNHEEEEDGIVYFADDRKADLIAIGIHENSRFRRMINGGPVAEEVKNHTFRPVMTYKFESKNK